MPFEISPQFEPAVEKRVGPFQKFADALLKGCAITTPIKDDYLDGKGGACAVGAMLIGLGVAARYDSFVSPKVVGDAEDHLEGAYRRKYGRFVFEDNDSGRFTREQIAARIADL